MSSAERSVPRPGPTGESVDASDIFHEDFFDHVSSGIAIYKAVDDGQDFIFLEFNRAAERIDGICRADVIGRRVTDVFPGVADFGLLEVLRRVWSTGRAEHLAVSLYRDHRVSGWRENRVFRLPGGEIVAIYDNRTDEMDAEKRFRSTFEQAAVGMAHIGLDGRFLRINDKLCEITGYSRSELQARTFQDITHPDDLDSDLNLAKSLWAGHIPHYRIEKRYLRPDGSCVWINLTASAVRDPQGEPEYGIAVVEDITAEKEAEALRANEELQRMALSAAKAGAWEYDFIAARQVWTAETAEMFGVDPAAPAPSYQNWLAACVDPRDRHLFDDALKNSVAERGSDFSIEFRSLHPHKGQRWLLSVGKLICDDASRPLRAYGLNLDISERREMEEALRTSEARLRMAMAAGDIDIWEWDISTGQVIWSDNIAQFMHMDPKEFGGTVEAFRALVHPDDRERVEASLQQAFSRSGDYHVEFRMRNPAGRVRWTETRGIVVRDRDGEPVKLIGVDMEITERKAAEEHRALLAEELNHRIKNLLSVVEATMRLTWRSASSPEAFREAFLARLHAIASGNNLLLQTEWQPVGLADLLQNALHSFGSANRIVLPPDLDVRLPPNAALGLNLILHELGTNAAKYGALSCSTGFVTVECWVPANEPGTLACRWKEEGGPPVRAPSRKGFGSKLIEQSARADLRGTASISFPPDGIECLIRFPWSALGV